MFLKRRIVDLFFMRYVNTCSDFTHFKFIFTRQAHSGEWFADREEVVLRFPTFHYQGKKELPKYINYGSCHVHNK